VPQENEQRRPFRGFRAVKGQGTLAVLPDAEVGRAPGGNGAGARPFKKSPPAPAAQPWLFLLVEDLLELGLCLAERPVRGSVSTMRTGLGWPTRFLALALTALVAENLPGLRFVMARMSME